MPGLDGLRALAVGAVVWHHAHPAIAGVPMSGNGFLGVDVFFVLSGFLITTLLLREHAQSGTVSLRNFYVRRALRIFPLYFLVLAVLGLYYGLGSRSGPAGAAFFADLPWVATYTSNWVEAHSVMAVSWSLSAEEQFYLVWPPLLAWLGLRRSLAPLLAFLLLNQAVNFGALDAWLPYERLPMLQATFTPIVLGVLLAFALHGEAGRRRLAALAAGPAPALLALALVAVMNVPGDVRGLPRLAFHLLTAALLAAVVLRPGDGLVRLLEAAPLRFAGKVSYGVYLLHMPVLSVVDRLGGAAGGQPAWLRFALTLGLTLAVAGASYRWFESPLLRLKGVLQARRAPPAASLAAGR
jgi:peptidoglycan/LPS O-acetylase OafA/YrhL